MAEIEIHPLNAADFFANPNQKGHEELRDEERERSPQALGGLLDIEVEVKEIKEEAEEEPMTEEELRRFGRLVPEMKPLTDKMITDLKAKKPK